MKKITIFILVTLLFFQSMGIHYFFNAQHKFFKEKITSKTEKSFLKKLTLSLNTYHKYLLDDHEIKINNKLYDIIEKKISGKTVVLKVISDDDEEVFNSKFKNQNKKNSTTKNKEFSKIKQFSYFPKSLKSNTTIITFYNSKILIGYKLKQIELVFQKITIPPPEFS